MGDFFKLNESETVQSLANAGKIGPPQFFSSIQLPEQFIRVPEKGFYGFSKGTVGGFEDE